MDPTETKGLCPTATAPDRYGRDLYSWLEPPTGTKGPPFISRPSPSSLSPSSAHFETHCSSVLASSLPPLFLHPFFDSSVDFFDFSVDSSVVKVTNLILSFSPLSYLILFTIYLYMVLYCGFFFICKQFELKITSSLHIYMKEG